VLAVRIFLKGINPIGRDEHDDWKMWAPMLCRQVLHCCGYFRNMAFSSGGAYPQVTDL